MYLSFNIPSSKNNLDIYRFFYPTLSRSFKNIELIGESVRKINKNDCGNFEVVITIDGSENKYAHYIVDTYSRYKNIKFIGKVSRNEVFELYAESDCLLFPSKLETWGLPITEFKTTGKLILAADLPYAYETVGTYNNVSFFDPTSPQELAALITQAVEGKITPHGNRAIDISEPFSTNWGELFEFFLSRS